MTGPDSTTNDRRPAGNAANGTTLSAPSGTMTTRRLCEMDTIGSQIKFRNAAPEVGTSGAGASAGRGRPCHFAGDVGPPL